MFRVSGAQYRVEALVTRGSKEQRVTFHVRAASMQDAGPEAVRAADRWVQQNVGIALPVFPGKHWQQLGRVLVYNNYRIKVWLYITY